MNTYKEALAAVKQNGYVLQLVPEEFITPELCLEAVKQHGLALQYVPKEFKTPELCLKTVKEDGYAIKYVPEELKTPELCLAAVKEYGYALEFILEYVPDEFKERGALLSEEEILAKYSLEEMLTSSNSWLRLKGRELNEHL